MVGPAWRFKRRTALPSSLIFRTDDQFQKRCRFQNRVTDGCWSGLVKGGSCFPQDCCSCRRFCSACRSCLACHCGFLAPVCIRLLVVPFRLSPAFLVVGHTLVGNCRWAFPDGILCWGVLVPDGGWGVRLECCLSYRVQGGNYICDKG